MTKKIVATPCTGGNFAIPRRTEATLTPIGRFGILPVHDIVEEVLPRLSDQRREPVRRDTSTTPSDVARAAHWGRAVGKLDVVVLESLVGNAVALAVSVRALASLVTESTPNPAKLRRTLQESHARGVDLVLALEIVRDSSRVLR